jgi:hypothetical protein
LIAGAKFQIAFQIAELKPGSHFQDHLLRGRRQIANPSASSVSIENAFCILKSHFCNRFL